MSKRISPSTILKAPYLNGDRISADIGNLMVLAPHPDDESLGCGGLIAMLKEKGKHVSVVCITSGSASHNSRSHPPEILTELRESEAKKACSKLGVPLEDVHFLRAPDSRLVHLDPQALAEIIENLASVFESMEIFALAMPWRRDPHPDHVVTHIIGDSVLKRVSKSALKIEYPIWLWKHGRKEDWPYEKETVPYRLDITSVFKKKWSAVKSHRSQLGEVISDDANGFVLTDELLEPFNTPTEYFFLTNLQIPKTLEKDYFDKLYTEQIDPWNFRNSEYEQGKYGNCLKTLGTDHFDFGLELGCSIGIQTEMLAGLCHRLLAIDISEAATNEAALNCRNLKNIDFRVADITEDFPNENFDLIICNEIGYYLEMEDLLRLFENVHQNLEQGGRFMMVHWTPFVPDYPLSGDTVHDTFMKFAAEKEEYLEIAHERHELYRLQVWSRSTEAVKK